MKSVYNLFLFLLLAVLSLPACKKDEIRTVVQPGTASSLTASTASITLDTARRNDTVVRLNWSASEFGFPAAVGYTLQLAKKGTAFAPASTNNINIGNAYSAAFTVAALNKELTKVIPAGQANDVEMRIKGDVGTDAVTPAYSNVLTFRVTPYFESFPTLYVPGDYQGWSPGTAAKLVSVNNDNVYEGYVYVKPGTLAFKITSDPDWNHTNYGDAGAGKLSTTGGDLKVPSAGFYQLKANLASLTWSATKTNWAIVGDATPGGWNTDTDLTLDADGLWTITTNLTAGPLKFRANDAWEIEYGDGGNDGNLEWKGGNITVSQPGNYTITLDLREAGFPKYILKKN